jgi:histidinol-phosphate aminotransferase
MPALCAFAAAAVTCPSVEHLLMTRCVVAAIAGRGPARRAPHILEMLMLNRRAFVQRLGIGTVGSLSLLETSAQPAALAVQNGARRIAIPADAIRIGSNENPNGPTASAIDAARMAVADGHRYPGAVTSKLIEAITTSHNVPAEQVMLSGGSGDLLRAAVRAFTSKERALVTGSPSYEQPVRLAQQAGVPVHEVPLTADLTLDLAPMLAKSGGSGLVYISNPNNPTSTIVPSARVRELIEQVAKTSPSTIVVVDEAYFEFADDPAYATLVPLIARYPSVVIARTFSKIHGMAGMRVGYAMAQEKTLAAMREQHSASGISVMSFAAAAASLADTAALQRNQALNRETRIYTVSAFEKAGFRVAASQANFVMVDVRRDAKAYGDAARSKGVYIGRPFPPLTNWARITIGTQQEMQRAVPVLIDLLKAPATTAALRPLPAIYESWC